MTSINLYLDDNRPAPPNWTLIKSGTELVNFYQTHVINKDVTIDRLSLDNDMPEKSLDGDQALRQIINLCIEHEINLATISIDVHSTNFIAKRRMISFLLAAKDQTTNIPAKIITD